MVCVGLFSCPDPLIALEHVGLNLGLGELSDRLPEHLSFGAGLEFCKGQRDIGSPRSGAIPSVNALLLRLGLVFIEAYVTGFKVAWIQP